MTTYPHKRKGERGLNVRQYVEPSTVIDKSAVTQAEFRALDVLLNGNRAERRELRPRRAA